MNLRHRKENVAETSNGNVSKKILKLWNEIAAKTKIKFVFGVFLGKEVGIAIFCPGRTKKRENLDWE